MANKDYIPRPAAASAAPTSSSTTPPDQDQLGRLRAQVHKERQVAEKALEETLSAREERDKYRQVLAASMHGEKLVSAQAEKLELELDEGRAVLTESASETGRLKGCNSELELRLQAQCATHDEEVATLKAELRAERERFERDLEAAILKQGLAEGRLVEQQRELDAQAPSFATLLRVRAVGLLTCSAITFAAAIAFLPPLFRALFGSPSPEEMLLAVGMSGWALLGAELLLLTLAIGLLNRGTQDLKASGKRE